MDVDIDFKIVCRICLLDNKNLSSIFAKSIVEGYLLEIPSIFTSTVDCTLNTTDERPKQICGHCKTKLINLHMFKQKCLRINQVLQTTDNLEDLDILNPEQCCRICLNVDCEKLLNLMAKTIIDGTLLALPAVIFDCMNIEIKQDDRFSKNVCTQCKAQILNLYSFKQKCKRTELALECVFNVITENKVEEDDQEHVAPKVVLSAEETTKTEVEELVTQAEETDEDGLIIDETLKDHTTPEVSIDEDLSQSDSSLHETLPYVVEPQEKGDHQITVDRVYQNYKIDEENDEMTMESVIEETNETQLVEFIEVQPSEDENSESPQAEFDVSRIDCTKDRSSEAEVELGGKNFVKSLSNSIYLETHVTDPHNEYFKSSKSYTNPIKSESPTNLEISSVLDMNQSFVDDSPLQIRELSPELYTDTEPEPEATWIATTSVCSKNEEQIGTTIDAFPCPICARKYTHKRSRTAHMKREHAYILNNKEVAKTSIKLTITEQKIDPNGLNEDIKDKKCLKCNKFFQSKAKFNEHEQFHKAIAVVADLTNFPTCQECHIFYGSDAELASHNLALHPSVLVAKQEPNEVKLFVDDECVDYQFLDDLDVVPNGESECGVCRETFDNSTEAKQHMIGHLKMFSCVFCGTQYNSLVRLSTHMWMKHLNSEYKCQHCKDSVFVSYFDFKFHIKNDCKARKFECTHCDKYFLTQKSLTAHLVHAADKKYQCHCGKSFRQKGELKIHDRTHTGEKNFACKICSKSYRTASMRADHQDTHINGKTFECTICHLMLQTRTVLRNHLRRHEIGKTHSCINCEKKFHTKYQLKVHTQNIHLKSRTPKISKLVGIDE